MSIYTVVKEVPARELYATVAATPSEAEKNVVEKIGEDNINRDDVNAVATLEGLQMFAEDSDGQTTKMKLGE